MPKKVFVDKVRKKGATYRETADALYVTTKAPAATKHKRKIQNVVLNPSSIIRGGLQNILIKAGHELRIGLWVPRDRKGAKKFEGQISIAAGTGGSGHQKEARLTYANGKPLGKFSKKRGTSSTVLPWTVGYEKDGRCELPPGKMIYLYIRPVRADVETRIHLNRQR
jgi:hypothetical protein